MAEHQRELDNKRLWAYMTFCSRHFTRLGDRTSILADLQWICVYQCKWFPASWKAFWKDRSLCRLGR